MGREILFRAKAINREEGREYRTNYINGDWVYGLLSKPYIEVGEYSSAAEMTNTSGVSGIEVDHETIGQYTGLTDKNGVKIFEGDIIKTRYTKEVFAVIFDELYSAFAVRTAKWVKYRFSKFDGDPMEVIGNIHDNPELLGGDPNA